MRKFIMVFGKMHNDEDGKDFEELKELLGGIGVSIEYVEEKGHERLSINWDSDEARKKKSRGAGAKEKFVLNEDGRCVKLSEAEALLAELGADRTAEKLGIGRATLFRKLKKARACREEYGDDLYL